MYSPSTRPDSSSQSCGFLIARRNFYLATCLCVHGSEVNLQSNSFLPDNCVFDSPHPVIPLPWREILDTLFQADNVVVIYQPIWSLRTFGMPTKLQKLSLRMTTSIVPKKSMTFTCAILGFARTCHRRCFLLESGPLERPDFRFLHTGFKSAEKFLKQKVTPKFGEYVTIAEMNGIVEYSRELECLRRDSQRGRPSRLHSSSYTVLNKWCNAICEYFYEHHFFYPTVRFLC